MRLAGVYVNVQAIRISPNWSRIKEVALQNASSLLAGVLMCGALEHYSGEKGSNGIHGSMSNGKVMAGLQVPDRRGLSPAANRRVSTRAMRRLWLSPACSNTFLFQKAQSLRAGVNGPVPLVCPATISMDRM
jgi:hypothetical protein